MKVNPYVCLREHTSTTLLDDNIEDWKKLVEYKNKQSNSKWL